MGFVSEVMAEEAVTHFLVLGFQKKNQPLHLCGNLGSDRFSGQHDQRPAPPATAQSSNVC